MTSRESFIRGKAETIVTVCFLLSINRKWFKWRVHVWQKQTFWTAGQSSDVTRGQQLPNSWRAAVQHAGINVLSRKRPSSGRFQRQSELCCLQHHRDTNSSSRTNIQLLMKEKTHFCSKHQRKENKTSQNVKQLLRLQNLHRRHRYVIIMSLLKVSLSIHLIVYIDRYQDFPETKVTTSNFFFCPTTFKKTLYLLQTHI